MQSGSLFKGALTHGGLLLHLLDLGDVVPLYQHCWRAVHGILHLQCLLMACTDSMQLQHYGMQSQHYNNTPKRQIEFVSGWL